MILLLLLFGVFIDTNLLVGPSNIERAVACRVRVLRALVIAHLFLPRVRVRFKPTSAQPAWNTKFFVALRKFRA
jgi:hypothetical protein